MKILLIILLGFVSFNAQATVTITDIDNSSNTVDLDDEEESIHIMGGLSGISKCTGDTTTIDSCARSGAREACNYKTVCPTTKLGIALKSDNSSGRIVLVDQDDDLVFRSSTTYTSGQTQILEIPWSTLCPAVDEDQNASCSDVTATGTETFKIGVDTDGDDIPNDSKTIRISIFGIGATSGTDSIADSTFGGVDTYSLYPGDEKAYITDFAAIADYTADGAAPIVALRGFFIQSDCATVSATPTLLGNTADSIRVELDEDNKDITDNSMDEGLANDLPYVFMFGFEDEAGNIGLFKDLSLECTANKHDVTPREVYGLLENNQNCFISTAAYGSPLNEKVKTFKLFRDQILSKFSLGQKFIKFYYQNSPPIAEEVKQNKYLKMATRALLWPAWAVSATVLYMGLMPFLFVVTMVLLSFVFLREKRSKKNLAKKLSVLFFAFGFIYSQNTFAQEDFFNTDGSTSVKESAPNEPPYNGTESDEFSDLQNSSQETIQTEEEYEPEIEEPQPKKSYSGIKENPNKWKPYERVPDEKRLDELSQKGLFKISKKGEYQYKVQGSPQNSAASFRFGMASFPNLVNQSGTTSFENIYGEDKKPMLMVDYEWQIFQAFGKLGIKVGSGLMLASGNGQFASDNPFNDPDNGPTTDAKEKYNFYMFPNSLAAIYRLDMFNRQWVVPFAEIGVDYLTFIETRDDGDDIKFGGAPHFHFAVGGSFLLDLLGRDMMTEIDRQYGVNHMWLTAEYRRLESMGADFDFSDDIINGGIMVEF